MLCEVRVRVSSFRLSMEVEVGWGVSQARLDRASFSYSYR